MNYASRIPAVVSGYLYYVYIPFDVGIIDTLMYSVHLSRILGVLSNSTPMCYLYCIYYSINYYNIVKYLRCRDVSLKFKLTISHTHYFIHF